MQRVSFTATAQPAEEPVTLGELRAQANIDDSASDALLMGYLVAARQHAESYLGRPILPTPMRAQIEDWAGTRDQGGPIWLDAPVISVDSVTYTGADGLPAAWTDYLIRPAPGGLKALRPATGADWPTLGDDPVITIDITAGWAIDLLPASVTVAICQTAAHWFNVREVVNIGNISSEIPETGKALLRPLRWRLIG
ncbi:phage head-tail connector protein [Sandarakinorhabdus sp.]|uniref:head-tail connector protein n=1 Tax=Sandarakinorhabdus sp. TaxID=1916663 RepID=UPI00286DED28|nr:phage head-tail connector protein [Sandarakinorhabdus sp.]